jgi:hypothetical protein
MRIAILGSGLSAAYAVQAAHDCGLSKEDILVVSASDSEFKPNGAQWLHWIPDSVRKVAEGPNTILSVSVGSEEEYLKKQWGRSDASSSFPKHPTIQYGWSVRLANHMIQWAERSMNRELLTDKDIKQYAEEFTFILHTFPTQISTKNSLGAVVRIPVYSVEIDFPARHVAVATHMYLESDGNNKFDGIVAYDGTAHSTMVRKSIIDGYSCLEFSSERADTVGVATFSDLSPFAKMPENPRLAHNVYPIGRYAEWDRKILSHHAYFKTCTLIKGYTTRE